MMRIKASIVALIFTLGVFVPVASAGIDDYYQFLGDASNKYTRRNYVADFFTLSYCQINDMLEIYEELDSIKDQMRTAASNGESIAYYQDDYKERMMEIYFIRELSEQDMSGLTEDELQSIEAQKSKILDELESEMREAFVDDVDYVNDGDFDDYFAIWRERYDDMVVSYRRCEEGSWWELQETWTDFIETWQDFGEIMSGLPDNFEKEKSDQSFWEKLSAPVQENVIQPIKTKIDAWKSKKEQKALEETENVEAEKTVRDVAQDEGISTFQEALDLLSESSATHQISSDSAERMARYWELYGEGGSLAASNMQGLIQTMNLIVEDSTINYLPGLEQAAEKIYDKQCN